MIQKVLSGIGGVGVYGVISVVLFFAVFVGVLVWVWSLRRPYLEHMSQLPLENQADSKTDLAETANRDFRHE